MSDVVRSKALMAGAGGWIEHLPDLVPVLADEWEFTRGPAVGGTARHVNGYEILISAKLVQRDGGFQAGRSSSRSCGASHSGSTGG